MSSSIHVVCARCEAVNRIGADRPAQQAVCGKCGEALFAGRPIEIDGAQRFDKHVARDDMPVIVDFWAPWCAPCRAMAPVFERAARELEPRARFVKVNVDDNPDLAARFNVRGIPMIALFRQGKLIAQQAGVVDLDFLRRWAGAL